MKFIQYFIKEIYGYHEFKAKNREEADKMMDRFFTYSKLDEILNIKDNGWQMTDLDEERKLLNE